MDMFTPIALDCLHGRSISLSHTEKKRNEGKERERERGGVWRDQMLLG